VVLGLLLGACGSSPSFVGGSHPTTTAAAGAVGEDLAAATDDTAAPPPPATTAAPVTTQRPAIAVGVYADGRKTWPRHDKVHLELQVTNNTDHLIGVSSNRAIRFQLLGADDAVLWNDQSCVRPSTYEPDPTTGFVEVRAHETLTLDSYYPSAVRGSPDDCLPPAGPQYLDGQVTICDDLREDWTCPTGHEALRHAPRLLVRLVD
jgi:hypothetical protein